MQSSLKPIAVGACVAALTGAFLVGPAAAAPAVPTLVLTVQDRNTLLVPDIRTLGCDEYPNAAAGSHPDREGACAALETAGGDFEKLPAVGMTCPMIYDPVTATARGTYRGKPVDFEAVYANACVAAAESGNVFGW